MVFKIHLTMNLTGDANNSIFIYSGRTSKAVEGYQTGRRIQFDNPLYKTLKEEFKMILNL